MTALDSPLTGELRPPADPGRDPTDTVRVLSPEWHLRPNFRGAIVYKFNSEESMTVHVTGEEAIALSLCDGTRTLDGVRALLARILEGEVGRADQAVARLLAHSDGAGGFVVGLDETDGTFTRTDTAKLMRALAAAEDPPWHVHRLEAPLSLLCVPTYRCQTDCIYCYAERPALPRERVMAPGRWVEILTEAGQIGAEIISFSSGDALTYPYLDDLLAVAQRFRMSYVLATKTLVSHRRAERLAALLEPHGQLQVSVDSLDAEVAAAMTGVPHYAERARTTIGNLRGAEIPVRTNTVVTPFNLDGVEDLIRELRDLGVHRTHVTNYYRSHYRHRDELFLSPEQIDELNATVRRLRDELSWPELFCNAGTLDYSRADATPAVSWADRARCSGGFSSMTILPTGEVTLCEQVPQRPEFVVGNVAEHSLMEVWNSAGMLDFLVPDRGLFAGTACEDCDEFEVCHRLYGRCFRDAYFNFGRLHAPSPNCPRAPLGLRMG